MKKKAKINNLMNIKLNKHYANNNNLIRISFIFLFILFALILRLLPHPPNFSPLGALALFSGGMILNRKFAFLLPLILLFISDLILGFHITMPVVYLCFIINVVIGFYLKNNIKITTVLNTSILGSLIFFLFTNFSVWLLTPEYPKNLEGLIFCYIKAIPFFQNTLISTIFYSYLFIYTYKLIGQKFSFIHYYKKTST